MTETKIEETQSKAEVLLQKYIESNSRLFCYLHDNNIVKALQGSVIRHCSDKQVVTVISACLEKARFDLGLRADAVKKEDNKLFIDSILADIRLFWYTLTLEQIPFVFYNGSHYKYDDKVFMTPALISQWFSKYLMSAERLEANKILTHLAEPPAYVPTPEEQEQKFFKGISDAFEKFKRDGGYTDYSNLVYDNIERHRKIPFDAERKARIAKKAKENLIAANSNGGRNVNERNKKAEFVRSILAGKEKASIITEAKQIALNEFFNDFAEIDEDIIDWLKQTPE